MFMADTRMKYSTSVCSQHKTHRVHWSLRQNVFPGVLFLDGFGLGVFRVVVVSSYRLEHANAYVCVGGGTSSEFG